MAAFIGYTKRIREGDLLAGLNAVADRLAALDADATAFVEGEFGFDQVAMVLQQPLNPQGIAVEDFLVGFQRQNDIAVRPIALLLVTDEVGHESCYHVFVVARAAAVEVAVLFGEPEGVERPVLAFRFDHVEMGEQQDWLARSGAAQPCYQVALARRRLEHLHVGIRETCRTQPRRYGIGGAPRIAGLGDGVDLHEFPVDVDGELLLGRQRLGMRRPHRAERERQNYRGTPSCSEMRGAATSGRPGLYGDAGAGVRHGDLPDCVGLTWSPP